MPITVSHQPDISALGGVAQGIGQGQAEQQAFSNAMGIAQLQQRERMQQNDINRSIWSQLSSQANNNRQFGARLADARQGRREGILANQQSQLFAQFGRERMAQIEKQARAENMAQQEQMRNRLANADWARQKEMLAAQQQAGQQEVEFKLSAQQKHRQQALQNAMNWTDAQLDWSEDQRAQAKEALAMQFHNIQPLPQPTEAPEWPEGREPGMIYEDRGQLYTNYFDNNGNKRIQPLGESPTLEADYNPEPFRRGFGLYQKDEAGKDVELIAPPQFAGTKERQSIFDSILKSMGANDGEVDFDEAERRTDARVRTINRQILQESQEQIDRYLNPDASPMPPALNHDPAEAPMTPPELTQSEFGDGTLAGLAKNVGSTSDRFHHTEAFPETPSAQISGFIQNNVGALLAGEALTTLQSSGMINTIGSQEEFDVLNDGDYFIRQRDRRLMQKTPDMKFDAAGQFKRTNEVMFKELDDKNAELRRLVDEEIKNGR